MSREGPATRMRSRWTAITRTGRRGVVGVELRGKKGIPAEIGQFGCLRYHWCLTSISVARRAPTHEQQGNTPARSRGIRHSAGSTAQKTKPARQAISRERCGVAIRAPPAGWTQRQSPTSPSSHLPSARMCRYRRAKSSIGPVRSYHALILLAPGYERQLLDQTVRLRLSHVALDLPDSLSIVGLS